jgi:hypothetical protein
MIDKSIIPCADQSRSDQIEVHIKHTSGVLSIENDPSRVVGRALLIRPSESGRVVEEEVVAIGQQQGGGTGLHQFGVEVIGTGLDEYLP